MVFVDCSNPYTRDYIAGYAAAHEAHLDRVRAQVRDWVADSHRREQEACERERRSRRPYAAVFDIDEVVLCNIHMNRYAGVQNGAAVDFHAADHFAAPDGLPWPRADCRLNPLLPGARELLAECLRQGLRVFFVTGRVESIRDETIENFRWVGLTDLFDADKLARGGSNGETSLHMCPDAEKPAAGESIRPFKEARRRAIEQTHRIVFNIGDQISDLGLHGDVQVHAPHIFYWTP
ncbi:MAG: HAD family acid phosphatase [Gemmatimonadaceae bacterium]|jgi:predicted secreted acid phosphatase